LIDRLYLGLLSTFSILISYQAIKRKFHPNNNYYLANILINTLFIIVIASKVALVTLFVLVLIRQFYGQRKVWKITIAIGAMVAVVGLFFIMKNESANRHAPEETRKTFGFIENSMTYELRAVVWECFAKITDVEGFTLTGIGFEGTNAKLLSCYESHIPNLEKREEFIANEYNTHNQFLDFYLSAGFIALLLFLVFVVVSFLSVRKQFLPSAMLAILIMYCSIENV